MQFQFKAKDQEGRVRDGMVNAPNQDAAIQIIQQNNLIPVSIKQEKASDRLSKALHKMWERVTQKELVIFFRQFSALIEAKVPIVSALKAISEQVENKYFTIVLHEVVSDVEEGMTFSESLGKHPDVFEPLIVNLIKAGELSGNLQKSVSYIADSIEKNYQLTGKIKSALFYPAFVILIAGGIGFLVVTFILPKMTSIIREMGVPVPWYTRIVMAVGDFMAVYWWAVMLLMIVFIIGIFYYLNTEEGKYEWEVLQLKIPIVGTLLRYAYLARFADTMSTLVVGGLPMVRSLIIVSDVIGNTVYKSIMLKAAEEVRSGGTVSSVFMRYDDIPPVVTQMVKIGEETGKFGQTLESVSKFYSQEVDYMTKNLTALLEPILIVVLGIGVAILVFSIILPIYNIAGQI